MSHVVRTFEAVNRLADAIAAPGGMTVAEALARAATCIEEVREECLAALDDKIAELEALAAREGRTTPSALARVYVLANEILSEAGAFGLHELSEAGRSLCELISHCSKAGLDAAPLRLHVSAIKALRQPDVAGGPALRREVLTGLRRMTAKLSAQARASA
jgi:hypothetical protein